MYVILIAPFWLSKEWFPDLLQATVNTPCFLPMRPDLQQPHFHRFHDGLHVLQVKLFSYSSTSRVFS